MEPRSTATILQHFGDEYHEGAIAPPIFQASNFVIGPDVNWAHQMKTAPGGPPYGYSRLGNPTLDLVERKLAKLEGTEACKVTGSGQGAIATTILASLRAGAHVVCVDTAYGPVSELLNDVLKRFGVTVTYVSGLDTQEVLDAIQPETALVYLESPSSIMMRLQDIRAITKVCKEKGIRTAIDNTYSTPLFQNPREMGVDVVIHSASKYLSGHSDLCAGAICGDRDFINGITLNEINLVGTVLAPFPAWLLMRGMRSLAVRMKHHNEAGNYLAGKVEQDKRIDLVRHVGLPSFDQRALFESQMKGAGSLFTIEPKEQSETKINKFIESLNYFQKAVSWGGYESLAMPLHVKPLGFDRYKWVVRLFAGLEDPEELWEDLQQAMDVAEWHA